MNTIVKWTRTALLAAAFAGAAVPAAAGAQMFLNDPKFPSGPIEPNDPVVGLPIPGATPDEYRAHLLWNLRSGLNVAALQCQFSPYLRAVANYNALIDHHSKELGTAYESLTGYFKRLHGPREGLRHFDEYSTQTYNDFSTFQAQYGFCQTAAEIAKQALRTPKGGLQQVATNRMRELRGSLVPAWDQIVDYYPGPMGLAGLHFLGEPDCSQLRGRAKKRCERQPRSAASGQPGGSASRDSALAARGR